MTKWNEVRVTKLSKYLIEENKREQPYKIPWRGDIPIPFDVYKVPIEVLNYNFESTRLRAELENYFHKKGVKINPEDREQQSKVRETLLSSQFIGEESELLSRDLIRRGQLDPGVATIDGTVIDGNRRLAIFHKLIKQGHTRFKEMEICVLPEDATETELKELEMRIQMSRSYRLQYHSINIGLEFRNLHRNLGWPIQKIESVTGGYFKKSKIERMIKVIELIDEYLSEYPPKGTHEKEYTLVEKGWESFDNLHACLVWSSRYTPNKTNFHKKFGFQLIKNEVSTYIDVRSFRHILQDNDLRPKLESASDTLRGKHASTYLSPNIVEREWRTFQRIKESYRESQDDPKRAAKQALKKLLRIKETRIRKGDTELIGILNDIEKIVKALKSKTR